MNVLLFTPYIFDLIEKYFDEFINNLKLDENYEYFFCPSGIGDTLYVLGYMREYKRNFQNKKVIFIVKEAHKFLVDMYSKYVDGTIVVSKFYHKLIEQHLKENLNIEKKIIYAHPLKIISDPCKILGVKDICLLDLYKILLNIWREYYFFSYRLWSWSWYEPDRCR